MANLPTKIKQYLTANGKDYKIERENETYQVRNDADGRGDYLDVWTVEGLARPTDEQLATYEDAGNIDETNRLVRVIRRNAYGEIGDQLDEIFKDIDAWKARIQQIKTDNPKE